MEVVGEALPTRLFFRGCRVNPLHNPQPGRLGALIEVHIRYKATFTKTSEGSIPP